MSASQAFSQKLYEAAARDANAAGTSASGQAEQRRRLGRRRRDRRRRDRRRGRVRPTMTRLPDDRDATSEDATERADDGRRHRTRSPPPSATSVAGDDATTEDELASEIDAEIAELAAERDQFKDIAQRVQADFENYRKRVAAADPRRGRPGLGASSPRRCCRCSTPPRRRSAPPRRGRAAAQRDAQRAAQAGPRDAGPRRTSRSTRTSPTPWPTSPATAARWSWPRCCAAATRWNGRTLRPAMVRTRD